MKKVAILLCICVFLFSFTGCSDTLRGEDALLERARDEIFVADADTIALEIAGSCTVGESCLIWFISGNAYQAHSYTPIEFKVVGSDEYEFVHTYKPIERGTDIVALSWKDGYSFVVNNPDCRQICITAEDGEVEWIAVENIPFVYYQEGELSAYSFLDAEGKEL